MRRREIIMLLGCAAAWPFAGQAQQPERMRRIGILMGTSESDPHEKALVSTFTSALAELGWQEGRHVHIEYRWAAGDTPRLRAHAAELARLSPDAMFAQGTPPTTALRQAAPTTPLVFVNVTDPVKTGLVSSLAHPGGNITGFSNYEFSFGGKWLEILQEIVPGIRRVAVIFNPENPIMPEHVRSIEAAAPTFGITLAAKPARNAEEFEKAVSASALEALGGLLVLVDFMTLAHRELIIRSAAHHRLPAGYGIRVFAENGGLFSYGVDAKDLFRRAATYVHRILKGARPADLPIQQPTKYELVINLKTAKALGIEVPPMLLARADEVIE